MDARVDALAGPPVPAAPATGPTRRAFLGGASTLLLGGPLVARHGQRSGEDLRIRCTPGSVEIFGQRREPTANPIARALEVAGPGSEILLDPGDYPPFSIGLDTRSVANAVAPGGTQERPVVVRGDGRARIVGELDALAVDQSHRCGFLTFRGLILVPGQRSGVIFYRQSEGRVHRGFAFEDCHVLGGYDHPTATGRESKWGLVAHSLADFRFVGVQEHARVERIQHEHAFYIQNHRGPVRLENVRARDLGRTFCQFTARAAEGSPGQGDVTIRGCVVEDACIAAGDAYKGGSALTFAGRLACTILLEGNVVRAGFRRSLRGLTLAGQPYGTGALVAWQGGEPRPNDTLILRDNEFRFADGCGDRALVALGGTRRVLLVGANRLHAGGRQPALALDPVDEGGRLLSSKLGRVYLAPGTRLRGSVTRRGEQLGREERRALELR